MKQAVSCKHRQAVKTLQAEKKLCWESCNFYIAIYISEDGRQHGAPTRIEFLFRVLLGIGGLFWVGTTHSSAPLHITSRSYEGETQKHGSTCLLKITMSLKLCRRGRKLNFLWFCVYMAFRKVQVFDSQQDLVK